MNSFRYWVLATLTVSSLRIAHAQTFTTNRTPVGMEHNMLFNAQLRFTVTQTGSAALNLPTVFDGRFDPSYTSTGPTDANPTVVLIEGLPGAHVQSGAWVGWSTRAWPALRFKIEGYDVYAAANTWRLVADFSSLSYTGGYAFTGQMPAGAFSKLRFTFYAASGENGRLGISELYFIHPEAVTPYQGLTGWTKSSNGIIADGTNVGIGTTSPAAKLDVAGGDLVLRDAAANPGHILKSYSSSHSLWLIPTSGSTPRLVLGSAHDWDKSITIEYGAGQVGAASGGFTLGQTQKNSATWTHGFTRFMTNGAERLRIDASGNVGIGTTAPSHKLSVNGTIKTKEVIVETTGWADDVFAPGYALPTLDSVEQHIAERGHLPGIPSAAEVAENGVAVGDMQAALLRKMEEMTLYMLETRKELAESRLENAALRARVDELEAKR